MTSTQPVIPTHMKIRNIQKDIRLYIVNHQILYERSLTHPQDQRIKQLMTVYQQLLLSLGRAQEELIYQFKEEIRTKNGEDNLDEIMARYLSWPDRHLINYDRHSPEKKTKISGGAELVKKTPTLVQRPGSKMKSVLKLKAERTTQQQSAPLVRKESERLKAAAATRTAEAAEAAANNVKQLQSLMKSRQSVAKPGGGMTLLKNKNFTNERPSTPGDMKIQVEDSQPGGLTLAVCGKLLDEAIFNSEELSQDVFLLGTVGLLHRDRLQEVVVRQGRRKRRTLAGQSSYYNDYHQPKKRSWKRKVAVADADSSDSSEDSDDSDDETDDQQSQESTGSPIKPDLMPKIVLEPMTDQIVKQLTGKNVDSDNTSEASSKGSEKAIDSSKSADILISESKKPNAADIEELSGSELTEKLSNGQERLAGEEANNKEVRPSDKAIEVADSGCLTGKSADAIAKSIDGSSESVDGAGESNGALGESLGAAAGTDVAIESSGVPGEIIGDASESLGLTAESIDVAVQSGGGASMSALSPEQTLQEPAKSTFFAGSDDTLAETPGALGDSAAAGFTATSADLMDVDSKSTGDTGDLSNAEESRQLNDEIGASSSNLDKNQGTNDIGTIKPDINRNNQREIANDSLSHVENGPSSELAITAINSEEEILNDVNVSSPSDEENERLAVESELRNRPINVEDDLSLEKLIDEVPESENSGDSDDLNIEIRTVSLDKINVDDDSLEKLIDEDTCDYIESDEDVVFSRGTTDRQDTQFSKTSDEVSVETDCSAGKNPDLAVQITEITEETNESSNSTFSRNKSDDDSPRCIDCVDEDTIVCSSCGEVYSKKSGPADCPVCATGPCTEDSGCPPQTESDRAWKGWCPKCVALRRDLVNEFEKCRLNLNKTDVEPQSLPAPNLDNSNRLDNIEPDL